VKIVLEPRISGFGCENSARFWILREEGARDL
jgi:hypothetical protein